MEKILARLAQTKSELTHVDAYDYVVYNKDGQIDETADDIRAIVRAESSSVKRHPNAATAYFE